MKLEPNGQSLTFCLNDESRPPKLQRHYFHVATEEQRDWLKELIKQSDIGRDDGILKGISSLTVFGGHRGEGGGVYEDPNGWLVDLDEVLDILKKHGFKVPSEVVK